MVSKEETILGIDCGTRNIRTCIFHNETNIEILYNNDGDRIQSYVSFSTEIFIGKRANIGKPTNTVSEYMQILGRKSNEPEIVRLLNNNNIHIVDDDGIPKYKVNFKGETLFLRPELIGAIIFSKIQSEAIAHLNSEIKGVVITVPLHFNQLQRQATLDSACIAGLNVLRIVNEPTAAALAYYTDIYKSRTTKTILVYHLGASTFDLSVINLSDLGITVQYSTGGYNLGGIYINEIIYDWVVASLRENEYKKEISYILRHNINKEIEEAKVQLQKSKEAQISVHSCNFDKKLSRSTLGRLINKCVVEKTMAIIDETLKKCNLREENIDDVLLLGGSCKITAIMEKLESKFRICNTTNMEHLAARGAAILGAKLQHRLTRNFEINEYLNTYLSVNKEMTDETIINLDSKYENRIEIRADNENQPKLGVNYYIDDNGILKISTLQHETGLTESEIDVLKNQMELITEQNESLRSIKQALNELRITVNNYRREVDELEVFEKYKAIYRNICDDVMNSSNNPNSYNSARKIMRKKKSIENYVNFVKGMVNEEVTYDCIG